MISGRIQLTGLLVFILGVSGFFGSQSTSVFADTTTQSVQNHRLTVTDISAQPSGILIRVRPQTISLSEIVSQVHITPGEGRRMPRLTVKLDGVTPGATVPLDKVTQVWNQTLYSIEVHKETDGLDVAVSFEGPYNRAILETSANNYLGISLAVQAHPLPPLKRGAAVPLWYLRDLTIANRLQFKPTSSIGYSYMLPAKPVDKRDMLAAPFRGTQEALGYGSYFGAVRIGELYKSLDTKRTDGSLTFMRRGTVLERINGRELHVPAALLGLPNSWSLGFARNQIIIASEHAGVAGYTVYDAPGISIP